MPHLRLRMAQVAALGRLIVARGVPAIQRGSRPKPIAQAGVSLYCQ